MPKLYEIAGELDTLVSFYEATLTDTFGEVTPEVEALEQQIAAYLAAGKDKIESAAMVVKNLEAEAVKADSEAKRLANRAKSFTNNAGRLKALIQIATEATGGKHKFALFTVRTQNNPPSYKVIMPIGVDLMTVAKFNPEFVKVVAELRHSAFVDAFKSGTTMPPGFSVVKNEITKHLRIE